MSEQKGGFGGMVKLGIVLALYATAACVGLAFVYAGTEKIITERQRADMEAALSELFANADEFKAITDLSSPDPMVTIEGDGAFAALKSGTPIGVAMRTSRAGYGGAIKTLVGVGADGRISGVKILEHSETPGLGANATRPVFYGQFTGKPVSDPFVVKQDVDTITAATITSRAVAASVKAAGEAAAAWFPGGAR